MSTQSEFSHLTVSHTKEKPVTIRSCKTVPCMDQNCLANYIIYEATIVASRANVPEEVYIGLCDTSF